MGDDGARKVGERVAESKKDPKISDNSNWTQRLAANSYLTQRCAESKSVIRVFVPS